MSFQKRRTTYRLGRCLVELDELPMLGAFIEIEGPSERQVFAVAGKLGLGDESIKISYSHMMAEACLAAKRSPVGIKAPRRKK
jgi:adenylate cyclase class IV